MQKEKKKIGKINVYGDIKIKDLPKVTQEIILKTLLDRYLKIIYKK